MILKKLKNKYFNHYKHKSFIPSPLILFLTFCVSITLFFSPVKNYIANHIANKINYSKNTAINYSRFKIQGTSWLSFRDIPDFVKKYVKGKKTLDLGCGAGRSTRFLKNIGLHVTGVDINKKFIDQAYKIDKLGKYILIEKNKTPFKDNTFNFVFSSHVLLMIPTKNELNQFFAETHRILKKGGIFIAVTGSKYMHDYNKKWVSYNTRFPENKSLKSGKIVKLEIKEVGAIFHDYNWENEDYLKIIKKNNFEVLEIHYPKGKTNEQYQWLSEKNYSPYIIYILKKI